MKKKFSLNFKVTVPILKDIAESFKQIQWPSIKEVSKHLLAVLVISAIIGAYLGVLDTSFENLRNIILFN
jgi:preprotein translocase SecE subunit